MPLNGHRYLRQNTDGRSSVDDQPYGKKRLFEINLEVFVIVYYGATQCVV